jgi:hypothetical protein
MSKTLATVFSITPDTHGAENGHWDSAKIVDSKNSENTLLSIYFQNGPVAAHGVNGVQLPQVLRICLARYKMLNKSFPCRENSIVIRHLEDAIMWDDERTAKRTTQGVEGYDRPHKED